MRVDKLIYTIKVGWVTLLYRLGILLLLKRLVLRNKAVALMYHRVLDADAWGQTASHPGIIVRDATFAMHLDLLRRWFRVITLDEFIERLQKRQPFESASCLITFDDGWLDNYRNALPILLRSGLPATIFVPTDYIGTGRQFWREKAVAVIRTAAMDHSQEAKALLGRLGLQHLGTLPTAKRQEAIQQFLNDLKTYAIERRTKILAALDTYAERPAAAATGVDRFIDWQQARSMADHGITFGSHGHSHHLFDQIEHAAVDREIRLSRELIERELARPVTALSYPNGNHDQPIAEIVREAGYAVAFSVQSGHIGAGDDPFRLRRISIHEDMTRSPALFLARILGVI